MPKTSFYSGTGITSEKADAVESSANSAAQSAADAATSESNALTSETNAATSESNALASATAAQNLEIASASFDTTDGTLTLTKANSGTVTTDLDGRYADLSGTTFTGDISFGDNLKAKFGNDDDLLIYHRTTSGQKSVIEDAGTGGLDLITNGNSIRLMTDTGDTMLSATKDSGLTLTCNNNVKLQTTIDGIRVWDEAQFDTNINVDGNITVTGTVDGVDIATLGANAIVDGDFTSEGLMKRTSAGTYAIDSNTYLTSEANDLSTAVTWADVPDANITESSVTQHLTATNVANAGALMDSEVTNLVQVKAFDSSDYATFTQGTTADNALPKSGGEVTGNISGFIDIRNFYDSLSHSSGSSQFLSTNYFDIGSARQYTHSGLGTKTIDISLDILYYNVNYTNDAEMRFVLTAPDPSAETTVNLGTVVAKSNPASYITQLEVSGDFTKHFSKYMGLAKSSDGTNPLGGIYKYYYSGLNNRTIIQMNTQSSPPSVGDTVYMHPFDWESSGTQVISPVYQIDGTTDSTVLTRRDFHEHLGYFSSSVFIGLQAKETGTGNNVIINELRGKLTRVGN